MTFLSHFQCLAVRTRERERERDEPRAGELGKYKDAVITNKAVLDAVDAPFRTRIHLVFPFGFPILSEYL